MATCSASSPVIDQAENLPVIAFSIFVNAEAGDGGGGGETLSAPSWSLSPGIPQLSIAVSYTSTQARFDLSAPNLFGLIVDGSISYVVGITPHTVTSFTALPAAGPADIYDFQPAASLEGTATLTLTVVSDLHGSQSFELTIHVTGSYDTARDKLVAAVAALGS